jgi:quercetin dioxygenase-like cupin family protein
MAIYRLYSGNDGESHMEELDLAAQPDLTKLHGAKGVEFRIAQPGRFSDWHTAPRRQYVITLSGEAEIGLGDGTVQRLKAGDVNLAEDLTGHGHTTRVVGNAPRVTATIHLDG